MKYNKGQIGIIPIIIGGFFTLAASALTSFATSNVAISEIRGEVRLVEQRENLHYEEIQKALVRIEKKLDEQNVAMKKK